MAYRNVRVSVIIVLIATMSVLASVRYGLTLPPQNHPQPSPVSPSPSPSETPKPPSPAVTPEKVNMKLATKMAFSQVRYFGTYTGAVDAPMWGQPLSIAVTLVSVGNGKGVDGRLVHLLVNGKKIADLTMVQGQASFSWTVAKGTPASSTIEAIFDGDDQFAASQASQQFVVIIPKKQPVVFFPPLPLTAMNGQPVTVVAFLYEDSSKKKPLAGKQLNFQIFYMGNPNSTIPTSTQNGGNASTDASGRATLTFPCWAHHGQNNIYAYFNSDNQYPEYNYAWSGNGVINVFKTRTQTQWDPQPPANLSVPIGQKLSVTVHVLELSNGHDAYNLPVRFYIDNNWVADVNTDRNGRATWLLPAVKSDFGIGNHIIHARVESSDFYDGSNADTPINIQPEQ